MSKAAELAALIGSQSSLSNRNMIINGAMQVEQRGTQTNQTSGYTACDRWHFVESGSTVITTSQSTDTPASQGFANSLKVDVTTASGTPSASHYAVIRQKLEGQDLQHLLYGTSSAKKITLSFWIKSPKTGKQYVELYHTDASYHNQQSYTIAAADTWQYVSLTYDGYETTAFNNDNGNSLMIQYWLMAGSDYTSGTTTENTWHNTNANRFSGLVNVVDDTANNWFLTGVQLEVGEQATPFEHRSFGDELARCQRYYYNHAEGSAKIIALGALYSSSVLLCPVFFPTAMRTAPSLEDVDSTNAYIFYRNGSSDSFNTFASINGTSENGVNLEASSGISGTAGHSGKVECSTSTAKICFDAEL